MYSINSGVSKRKRTFSISGLFSRNGKAAPSALKELSNGLKNQREKGELAQQILDNVPQLIYVRDLEGRYTLVNKAFEDFAGLHASDIVGKTDVELNIFLNADFVRDADQSVIKSGIKQFVPLEPFTDKNGNLFWFQTIKTPLVDANGKVGEILLVSNDVSKKVETEQRLTKSELRYRSIFENNYRWDHCGEQGTGDPK